MASWLRDFQYSLRALGRQRRFTVMVVLTLGLGVGAVTAVFSLLDAVVLRPLPYARAEQLVWLWSSYPQPGAGAQRVAPADFHDWRQQAGAFEGLAALLSWSYTLTGGGEPEAVNGVAVSPRLFALLRTRPALGRAFTAEEETPGRDNVVILSDSLWRRRFHADPRVVGQVAILDDQPHTILGVMPRGFGFPHGEVALWVPLAFNFEQLSRRHAMLAVLGRLGEGVTLAQAREEMQAVARALAAEHPESNAGRDALVVTLQDSRSRQGRGLVALAAAVAALLLIVCVNVASLTVARSLARQREWALRIALGCSRWRLLRLLLAESLWLALAGGAVGVALAAGLIPLLIALSPWTLPGVEAAGVDGRVLVFASAVALLAALACSWLPALRGAGAAATAALRQGGEVGTGCRPRQRHLGALLVAGEVALALCLLVTAVLLLRSFAALGRVPPGFDPAGLLSVHLALPAARYPQPQQRIDFYQQLLERLAARPEVASVAATASLPMSPLALDLEVPFSLDGQLLPGFDVSRQAALRIVTAGYFHTLDVPLLAGREFTPRDRLDAPPVALINDTMARRFFPERDAVGRFLEVELGGGKRRCEIVGVVGDVRHGGLGQPPQAELYWPFPQQPVTALDVVVRSRLPLLALVEPIKAEIWALDPNLPLYRVARVEDLVADSSGDRRFQLYVLLAFSGFALLLVAVGVYAVVAQAVDRRLPEVGIRLACGASRCQVVTHVLAAALTPAALGLGAGVLLSLALGRWLSGFLFEVPAGDPRSLLVAVLVVAATVLVAGFLPALRAAAASPMEILKYE